MKKIAIVITFLLIVQSSFAQADTILNRYKQYVFSSLKLPSNIDQLITALNANGQWPDINYHDQERGAWKPLIHLKRIRDLAFAYVNPQSHFYQSIQVLNTIKQALDHWLLKRYTGPNWWHNEIGVPQQMRDIIILLRPNLTSKQLGGALQVLAQYQIHDNTTGANLTWSADLGVHYGLLTNNLALAQKCRDLIIQEIKITTKDGVQPDYSFHQHGSRLQMYQYGGAFLWENIRLAWELRGTSLAFPKDKIALLTDFVLQGWQWSTRGINTVPGTMDRSASRKDALHSSDIRTLIPYIIDLIPERKAALDTISDHQNGKGALNGFRYFPYSDFAAYQQNEFSFFVKTISTRTLATEAINSENLRGHLLNSGDAYLIRNGQEYFNLMPSWNWKYLPGITSFDGADKIKRKSFVGSVGDGKQGFTSMDYVLENKDGSRSISAKKSWFCCDKKIVCLVADLKGDRVDSAFTVMDQCRWIYKVFVNRKNNILGKGNHLVDQLKWVRHGNFVYVPLSGSVAEIQLHSVTGKWKTINSSESDDPVQEKIFMPLLLHQNLSKVQSFGYMMTYSKTPADVKRISKHPGCKIIRNDSLCQSVLFADGTLMAAFFQPSSINFINNHISVDKPCLIMINMDELFVSDPQQINSSVRVQFNGKTFSVQLPDNGFSTKGILLP